MCFIHCTNKHLKKVKKSLKVKKKKKNAKQQVS